MKKLTISSLILISLLLIGNSCQDDSASPDNNNLKSLLIGPNWKIKTVNVDGVDYTTSYSGMTLRFTETTYTSTKGGLVWPSSGTWQLKSPDATKITRNDGIEITVAVTDTQLDLSLDWPETTYSGGRSSSLKGNHKFTFTK